MASVGLRRDLAQSAVRAAHRLLSLWPAKSSRVCVFGWPDFEENSLVAALALAESGLLDVTLLVDDPRAARRYVALLAGSAVRLELVRKSSVRGLVRASRARVLLFTHALYGAPDLTSRKLVINLWHGYGPKATANATFARRVPSGVMTCNTPVWAAPTARALGAPGARIIRTGNPRQVALMRPPDPAALHRLGLEASAYVLWMPTHRSSNGVAGPVWRDSEDLSARPFHGEGLDPISAVAELARSAGVDVVVKPHPLDADDYARSGLRVISTEEIFDAGMTLYQFIGSSAAMISDYSSVWVEYLHLDRPFVLYCPDLSEYLHGRGFNEPHINDIAKDLLVERAQDLAPFLDAVRRGSDWRPEARTAVAAGLQLPPPHSEIVSVASLVLDELQKSTGPMR